MIRSVIQLVCLSGIFLLSFPTFAEEPVKIGVLAYRPKPQTLAQWQPLAEALKQAIPERNFVVKAYTFPELEKATANNQLDFVLTNPGHYVLMAKRIGLSAPLATLAVDQNGQPYSVFGGVIFSRNNQPNMNTLSDIRGKTVAATSTDSFGGYQMEAYELLQTGVRFPQEAKLITTGMPHDNVVEAVLSGRADVGFVRTGVLEGLVSEGKLDMKQIKCLNAQNPPNFSLLVSTRLYPEWAFAVLPHVDGSLARHVAAALYVLEDNSAAVRAMNIHGFVVPPDYTQVADLLRDLRLPPFDVTPKFTMLDILDRYRWQVIGAFLAAVVIMILSFRLLLSRRKLEAQHHALQKNQQMLQESQEHIQLLMNSTAEGIYGMDVHGNCTFVNTAFLQTLGYKDDAEIVGKNIHELIHHTRSDGSPYPMEECRARKAYQMNEKVHVDDEVFWRRDGSSFNVEYWSFPLVSREKTVGTVTTFFDITKRKQMEEQVRQLAFYDTLTDLPNRRLLTDRLAQGRAASKRTGCYGALMLLDLDNFKPLNDAHGHIVGDLLLIEAANRLKGSVREQDTVARFGGDEFVVMLADLDTDKDKSILLAENVAEKIRNSLSEPYLLKVANDGREVTIEHHCTASIGVALFIKHEPSEDDILNPCLTPPPNFPIN